MLQRAPVAFRADVSARRVRNPGLTDSLPDSPPLDPSGLAVRRDMRRVSLRWLVGSVLTAFSGAALIGGAIIIALQGEIVSVQRPQKAAAIAGKEGQSARKADRLVRKEPVGNAARQEFKAPVTARAGNGREVIRTRDFVRVSVPLSQTAGVYARRIPPFNPLALFADSENIAASSPADMVDVDVSVVKHDLAGLSFANNAPHLSEEEASAQIAVERIATGGTQSPVAAQSMLFRSLRQAAAPGASLAYANPADTSFNDIDVRVIPENVTLLPKLPLVDDPALQERLIASPGAVIAELLIGQGASPDEAHSIIEALDEPQQARLREGQSLSIQPALGKDEDGRAGPGPIGRVILRNATTIEAIAALTDEGRYVPVFLPQDEIAVSGKDSSSHPDDQAEDGPGAPLYESLYETAARYDVPEELVREIIPLFAADADLQRRVAPGETLELLYTAVEDDGKPELLYAALAVEGDVKRLFRFQPQTGPEIRFFDSEGRSLQKFLIRKPITEGRMTSGFGMRYHPVMHYAKMHTGVDWAYRVGTPILAAGDGLLIKAGWQSGYGRRIEIQHANGYVSTYSHLSNFARGIQEGVRVRQGQVIGYLGATGLATGPHLHYEVMVNGRFVDPLKIKLPRSDELNGTDMAEFTRQRDQVIDLLTRAQNSQTASAVH